MARSNGHNIANGVLSGIVLACGITFSVLVATLIKKATDAVSATIITDDSGGDFSGIGDYINDKLPFWAIGFAYIVPAVLGIIASICKKKGLYITQMVFCILTLILMGISFVLGIFALSVLAVFSPDSCLTSGDVCKCGGLTPSTYSYTCEDLNSMYIMGVAIIVIMVFAWIITLATTIVVGILTCRQEPLQQGIIVQPMSNQAYVSMNSVAGGGPQIGYIPPTYINPPDQKFTHSQQY